MRSLNLVIKSTATMDWLLRSCVLQKYYGRTDTLNTFYALNALKGYKQFDREKTRIYCQVLLFCGCFFILFLSDGKWLFKYCNNFDYKLTNIKFWPHLMQSSSSIPNSGQFIKVNFFSFTYWRNLAVSTFPFFMILNMYIYMYGDRSNKYIEIQI